MRSSNWPDLFHKDADYLAFENILDEVLAVQPMRIRSYCLMPNHWHFVLWPEHDGDLRAFMQRLTATHVTLAAAPPAGRPTPVVTTFPPATATPPSPVPKPEIVRASDGHSSGHFCISPFSSEMALRFGPRHCRHPARALSGSSEGAAATTSMTIVGPTHSGRRSRIEKRRGSRGLGFKVATMLSGYPCHLSN
jgi:hypothetical protein